MTREEKEQTGKYVLQMARLLEDGCYQQEMLLKAVHIIDEALEQEPTTKNDLGVGWESYKDVDGNSLDDLILEVLQNNFDCGNTYGYKVADEIIELLPSLTPQEPRKITLEDVEGYCKPRCLTIISNELLYELTHPKIKVLEQEPILDKIRAEIIELRSRQNVGVLECLDIIDKYKADRSVDKA